MAIGWKERILFDDWERSSFLFLLPLDPTVVKGTSPAQNPALWASEERDGKNLCLDDNIKLLDAPALHSIPYC